jgi:phosphoenolpyruvate-protein phosphotransferase
LLKIMAPFDGWCAPLDEVPDEVFSGRMLGDGLAVDPTNGIVVAPCEGEILTLPQSGHAVSIGTSDGFDILVHIGIDTVRLGGKGFLVRVKPGTRVQPGEELIRFDLDLVARGAKSLMTPIVVTSDGVIIKNRRASGMVSAGELLFQVDAIGVRQPRSKPSPSIGESATRAERAVVITLQQGLHARPAALLARRAKGVETQITLRAHGRGTDARSVVGIMALGVGRDDELLIQADGAGAAQAVAEMLAGLEEAERMELAHARAPAPPLRKSEPAARQGEMTGICAVPGFAVGRATRIERREIEVAEQGGGKLHEQAELDRARSNVKIRLERIRNAGGAERHDIIGSIAALQALDDARLRERADDLLDVEAHVLLALAGEARPMRLPLPEQAILLADDLLPSELTALDRQRLAAIALSGGGATSHVAILAAAMEIPMLIGVGPALRTVADGQTIIVDADNSRLHAAPSADVLARAKSTVETNLARGAALRSAAAQECHSLDGTRIEVFANLGSAADAIAAVRNGAEGCGLLRTEFLFIERATAPTEEEQLAAYQSIAQALGGRPLILRMMDVGGDKPLLYLPLPPEPNPALGMRGVRTALAHPALMRTQLRAALRVSPHGIVRLLIPMVTDRSEIVAVRKIIEALATELKLQGRILLGAMIETPAAALTAAALLGEVDFLSIGTNDLTQYTLAMDRGHTELARRTDALHPAVLQMIAAAASAGKAAGKLVAVCGGVAADHSAVPILLGLGCRELSVVPAAVPAVKSQVAALRMEGCEKLAQRCLSLGSAAEVRDMVERFAGMQGDGT